MDQCHMCDREVEQTGDTHFFELEYSRKQLTVSLQYANTNTKEMMELCPACVAEVVSHLNRALSGVPKRIEPSDN